MSQAYGRTTCGLVVSACSKPVCMHRAQVSCGRSHTLCMTQDGLLFAWGCNDHGQLGLGASVLQSVCAQPSLVSALAMATVKVSRICCGPDWSSAVTTTGQVYCCTLNSLVQPLRSCAAVARYGAGVMEAPANLQTTPCAIQMFLVLQ